MNLACRKSEWLLGNIILGSGNSRLLRDCRKDPENSKHFFGSNGIYEKPAIAITGYYSVEGISVCLSVLQITMHSLAIVRHFLSSRWSGIVRPTQRAMVSRTQLCLLLSPHHWTSYWNFQLPAFYVYWALVMFLDRVARTQLHRWLQARGCDVLSEDAKRAVDMSFGLRWPDTWEERFLLPRGFLGVCLFGVFCLYCFVPWERQSLTGWTLRWGKMLISWSSAGLG